MWKCCVHAVHNFCRTKQQIAYKHCLRSLCYVSHVASKHLHVSSSAAEDPGVEENPLVKLARDVGLQPESLLNAAEHSYMLSQVSLEQLKCFFSSVMHSGLSCEFGLALLAVNPSFLSWSSSKFSEILEHWRICQLGEENLNKILKSHPHFLLIDCREIDKRIPLLKQVCSTKRNLCNLLLNCPLVMSENWTAVQEKVEYLQTVMKVENVKIAKSCVLNQSLQIIRTRHIFLERCGRYVVPHPKVDPLVANKNPSLIKIMDTDDKYFATKVAGVSLEEYEVFSELFAEEVEEEIDPLSDSEES